jgi:hypothetical protein
MFSSHTIASLWLVASSEMSYEQSSERSRVEHSRVWLCGNGRITVLCSLCRRDIPFARFHEDSRVNYSLSADDQTDSETDVDMDWHDLYWVAFGICLTQLGNFVYFDV